MKLDKVRSTHKSDDDSGEVGQSFEGKEVPKSGGCEKKKEDSSQIQFEGVESQPDPNGGG